MKKLKLFLPFVVAIAFIVGCDSTNNEQENIQESSNQNEGILKESESNMNSIVDDSLGGDTFGRDRSKIDEKEADKKSADYNPDEVKFDN